MDDDAVVVTCVCVWVLAEDFTGLDFSCCDVAEPGRVEEAETEAEKIELLGVCCGMGGLWRDGHFCGVEGWEDACLVEFAGWGGPERWVRDLCV